MWPSFASKNKKIDKFDDFSSVIYFNSKTDIFKDVISLIINQCEPKRPKGASRGHKVSANRAAQAAKRTCIQESQMTKYIYIYIYLIY